ncbi:hypothetical protein BCR43DRAFT_512144 [Syncephalastrum racemosum]|uniref:Peptidase M20 domain-containing protein 2 n=1 Tax=Syncephalastrum racemosum TaxID=13706 RepID=A0A1X2HPD8_SYNRA|nr:hypothetical protein BCR43DRAFT_512144 [Syncephalastrum racemosum]
MLETTTSTAPPTYEQVQDAVDISNGADPEVVQSVIYAAIEEVSKELFTINQDLHANPELGMQEHHAHQLLTDYLEKKGFTVTRHAYDMETAFTAEFSRGEGRRVGFCSEYDALPKIGHACGHNLIAIGGLACAIAVKALLESGLASGKVILYGTPAEERFIGKVIMVNKRAFQDNVDVCLMLHPAAYDLQYGAMTAAQDITIECRGKPSHAGATPWEGVNALDAIVQIWNNISMLRQQLKPTDRVHGIITHGGDAPNVIPEYTSAMFYVRTPKATDIERVMKKVEKCVEAAGTATGCEVTYKWRELGTTRDVVQNGVMADMYSKYLEKEGITFLPRHIQENNLMGGSTDMGTVSYCKPTIHPMYAINKTTAANHTTEFTKAAGTPMAHDDTIRASKGLAMAGALVLVDENYYQAVKADFEQNVPEEYRIL